MASPLLTTKFYTPPLLPRGRVVTRPHLIQRLDNGLGVGHRLALVSASAGTGKTTLLSEWVAHCRGMVAWLSLDEADNDPVRFWTYFIAALQSVLPDLGQATLQQLQASHQLLSASPPNLTGLINELAVLPERLILVLDDCHLISSRTIHDGLGFLLDHQPQQFHLVIATRADPPLQISRLRARGQLTELRVDDLRFSVVEATQFLNDVMGLDLAPDDVAALDTRTEGWIAGLQLAALSMRGRSDPRAFITAFTGSHHYVLEYLAEEVLNRQSETVRSFMLQTSILDRLCGPLCDAVTQGSGSDSLLRFLRQSNLFAIPLDDEHFWFRYHHLFADLLSNRLRAEVEPDDIVELYRRASVWHEGNGTAAEAMKHALIAGDYERAIRLIEKNISRMTSSGELNTLFSWIDVLPQDLVRCHPLLCVVRATAMAFSAEFSDVEPLLQAAEEQMSDAGAASTPEGRAILGNIATVRAFVADRSGDAERAIEYAKVAKGILPESDLFSGSMLPYILGRAYRDAGDLENARQAAFEMAEKGRAAGNDMTVVMGLCEQATLCKIQGQLTRATALYQQARLAANERSDLHFVNKALVDVGLADLLLERNDLLGAAELATGVVDVIEQETWGGAPTDLVLAYTTLARVRIATGDLNDASELLRKAERARQRFNDFPSFRGAISVCRVRLWLAQGDLGEAARWAEYVSCDQSRALLIRELEDIEMARVRIAQGGPRIEDALRLLARLKQDADTDQRLGRLVEILTLQAIAFHCQDDQERALTVLHQTLALAEPEGYVRVFLDGGRLMAHLLAQVRGERHAFAQQLLTLFPGDGRPLGAAAVTTPAAAGEDRPPTAIDNLIEPLSPRELEVLVLIDQGYSNREIATRLVVTLNTVKKHTSNIYGKLDVRSRTQAVKRAQELGLLE